MSLPQEVPVLGAARLHAAPKGIPRPRSSAHTVLDVAIVHERFTDWAGSEKVVEQMAGMWPDASLLAAVCDARSLPASLRDRPILTSKLQRPFDRLGRYEYLLPAMPNAMSKLPLPSDLDLVILSHHAFSNRVRVDPGTPTLSYVYSPARWMWDPSMLATESGPWPLRKALALWSRRQLASDFEAAQRVTTLVSISRHVQARILRWWDRPSEIVHPPVDTSFYSSDSTPREDFFLLAGRLVPYKQPDVAIAAALSAGVRLVVAGEGRMQDELRQLAGGSPLIEFVGRVSDEELRDLYRRCAAFIFPGEEDFGIVMAEAQSCGAPVIARQIGGAMDIVESGVTGDLYDVPGAGPTAHVEALSGSMKRFDHDDFDSQLIAESAQRFSRERFRSALSELALLTAAR
jgi:glycosyltransferase involved in cell wall biosynthesis